MTTIAKVAVFVIIIGSVGAGAYWYYLQSQNENLKSPARIDTRSISGRQNDSAELENEEITNPMSKVKTEPTTSESKNTEPATLNTDNVAPTTKEGDITIGTVSQGDVEKIQANVNAGNQPWRIDPMQVVQADSGAFGFTVIDQFELIETVNNISKIRAEHQDINYIIELNKPADTGPSGIWVIYRIIKEKT